MCTLQSKGNTIFSKVFKNINSASTLCADPDSSNYKITILKRGLNYSQLRFTIVDERNTPYDGIITLSDENKKGISGIYTNKDGKILVMVYDDAIKHIVVGGLSSGSIIIPIKQVKNTVADIKVQLYPFTFTN
jgi:hypothetical protein